MRRLRCSVGSSLVLTSLLYLPLAYGQTDTKPAPISVTITEIPANAAANIGALLSHCPDMPSVSNSLALELHALLRSAQQKNFGGFKSALEAAIQQAQTMSRSNLKATHYSEDTLTVLGAIARGESDLRKLPLHGRNAFKETGKAAQATAALQPLPAGFLITPRERSQMFVIPPPSADAVRASARRLAEVSAFPIGSPQGKQFDPQTVGYSLPKWYASALHSFEGYGEESRLNAPLRGSAGALRRILVHNYFLNRELDRVRRALPEARKGLARSNAAAAIRGALGGQPQVELDPVDRIFKGIYLSDEEIRTEQARIDAVYGDMFATFESNARKFSELDRIEVTTELKVSGARLLLQRELASIWERSIFPILKNSASTQAAELATVANFTAPAGNVGLICGDGSCTIEAKQSLTNVAVRVVWTNAGGGRGAWYGYFPKLDDKSRFIVPACGDFSTLHSAVFMPTLVTGMKEVLFCDPPTAREITLCSDQGTQEIAGPIIAGGGSQPSRKRHLAAMIQLGGELLASLPIDPAEVDAWGSEQPYEVFDPSAARNDLVYFLSDSKWSGNLVRDSKNQPPKQLVAVGLEIAEFDEQSSAVDLVVRLDGVGGKAAFYQPAFLHTDLSRPCVLALQGPQFASALSRASSTSSRINLALPAKKPTAPFPPSSAPWIPVEPTFAGATIASAGPNRIVIQIPTGTSKLSTTVRLDRVGPHTPRAAQNSKPAELSADDRQYLERLMKRQLSLPAVSGQPRKDYTEESKSWTPLDFAALVLHRYVEGIQQTEPTRRLARSSRDLLATARQMPVIRPTQTAPAVEPEESRKNIDRTSDLLEVENKGRYSQVRWDALNGLSDEGLESVKVRYLQTLRE